MENTPNKISYLDGIRGVAAFLVFFHHFLLAFYYNFYYPRSTPSHLDGWEEKYGQSLFSVFSNGHFCVCIFFVLSGFVLSRKYFKSNEVSDLISGAQRRFVRLYVPTAATIILACILMTTNSYQTHEASKITHSELWLEGNAIPVDILKKLFQCLSYRTMLFGDNAFDTTMWTISIEFYGSLFVFGFLALMHNTHQKITILVLVFLYCFFTDSPYLAAFTFGISLNFIEHTREKWNKHIMNMLAVVLLIISLVLGYILDGTFYANMPKWLDDYCYWFHIIGGFLLVLAFVLSSWLQYIVSLRVFRFLGYISFSLYLLHPLIIYSISCAIFLKVYGHLGYNSSVALVFLCTAVSCILFSWLMTKYIDGPGTKYAKYIYNRWIKKETKPLVITS